MYNDYISSMLTPFSVDEVNLKIQRTRYKVSTKCGEDKTFYRFGFNGKEHDPELKGKHNVQDYGFRMNDTRVGRFNTPDPLRAKFPMLSTYQFGGNTPIWATDLDGLEPNPTNGQIEENFVFINTAGVRDVTLNALMGAAHQELNAVYGVKTFNGNKVGDNGATYTAQGTSVANNGFRTTIVNILPGKGVSNFDSDNGMMNIYMQDVDEQAGAFRNNVFAHEYGHGNGLSDRYIEIGAHTSHEPSNRYFKTGRVTLSLVPDKKMSAYDPDYDYTNNLYSSGDPLLTDRQMSVFFGTDAPEPDWQEGFVGTVTTTNKLENLKGVTGVMKDNASFTIYGSDNLPSNSRTNSYNFTHRSSYCNDANLNGGDKKAIGNIVDDNERCNE